MADNLISPIIELGTVIIEVILIILYSQRLLVNSSTSTSRKNIGFTLFFLPLAVMSLCSVPPILRILYSFTGLTLFYRCCFDVDWPNSIYITAVFLILSLVSDIVCSYLVSFIGIPDNGITGSPFGRIIYNSIAKLTHLILIQPVPYLIKRKHPHFSFIGAVPLLTAQFASVIVCLCLYFLGVMYDDIPIGTVLGVLATLYINIVICFYVESISEKNRLEKEKELAEREYQHNLKYYESIKQSQEETRSLWHEIKKYLNTIHTLVDGGENSEAVQCMNEAEELFTNLTVNVDVGNNIISSILSIGLHQSKQHDIPYFVDAWVSAELGVTPQDLFIILGNAIDNAIEECCQLNQDQEPYINISIHQKGQMLAIKVENPCRPQQTPKPGKIHGYGLKNVKRCVDKYNGELQAVVQDGVFRFFVLLNMK